MPKPRILYFTLILVAVAATLGGEYVFGRFSAGTKQKEMMAHAADLVTSLPQQFGPWRSEHDFPLEGSAVNMLQCAGHINRTYTHAETGDVVTLTVMAGPTGPLVAHTPEICFSGRDYEIVDRPARQEFAAVDLPSSSRAAGQTADDFFHVSFRSRSLQGERLKVYYAWASRQGGWQAPDKPRLTLGSQPFLFKLQVGAVTSSLAADDTSADVCRRFLADALPALNQLLFAPASDTTASGDQPTVTDTTP